MAKADETDKPITQLNTLVRSKAPQRTVSSVLATAIRQKIMSGALAPGARIIESELAKTYGTSRSTVREALRELIAEDLVDVAKHKSPTVKYLDRAKVYEILSVRAVLEGYAAGLAASNDQRSAQHKDWLEEQLAFWQAPNHFQDYDAFVEANDTLHAGIRRMSSNATLQKQISMLTIPGYQKTIAPVPNVSDIRVSAKQHCELLTAILNGDPRRAETLMRKHVETSRNRVDTTFSDDKVDHRAQALSSIDI
ncbi:MAG: GntR family transcriptional regulator [Pseudomonadota bacterium]